MKDLFQEALYQYVYDYFKNIEFAYDVLKEIDGKTINQLTTEQYDFLHSCESLDCEVDTANNTSIQKYNFLKNMGCLACKCLEELGICTMFLSYYSIFVELVGPSDDMDRAMLKCNLLNINDYVQEFKGILLSLGFRL